MKWKSRSKKGNFKISFLKIILPALVGLLLLFAYFLLRSNIFTIQTVDVQAENVSCAGSSQIRDSAKLAGQNFFLVSQALIQKTLTERFICVKKIHFSKFFPNKIKLAVLGREAVAKLTNINKEATPSSSVEDIATPSATVAETYLIDDSGIIFSKDLSNLSIPTLYATLDLSLGKRVDNAPLFLKILEKLKTFGLNIQTALLLDKLFIIFPQFEQPKIIFKLDENLQTQIASLQLILKTAKINDMSLEFIDLRFDKPVIRFAPKKKNG